MQAYIRPFLLNYIKHFEHILHFPTTPPLRPLSLPSVPFSPQTASFPGPCHWHVYDFMYL